MNDTRSRSATGSFIDSAPVKTRKDSVDVSESARFQALDVDAPAAALLDAYNRHIGRDRRVAGIARQINWIHHCDESRHLAFGRQITRDLLERYRDQWPTGTIRTMETYLAAYLKLCWREYYNPLVYRDAGLADAYELVREAWQYPTAVAHRSRLSEKLLQYFAELGMNLGSGLQ